MKLRHAAALALVGWYLMLPESIVTKGKFEGYPDIGAPLTDWQIYQSFDSANDCENARDELANKWVPTVSGSEGKEKQKAFLWMNSPVCIATDDPRLK